jgi:ATP-dependent Clp endopeptidase proteolytic subunit ClpP
MPRIVRDWVDIYFDYGVDQTNRRIFLHSGIEEDTIKEVIKGIYLLQSNTKDKPIEIYVGTLGGDEYEMLGLYDVIRSCESQVITIGVGKVMSAGPLILAAGDIRKAFPHTSFMVHESWWESPALKFSEQEKIIKHYNALNHLWSKLMEDRTGTSAKTWMKMCKEKADEYFDVHKAKELGIIDHIIGEK